MVATAVAAGVSLLGAKMAADSSKSASNRSAQAIENAADRSAEVQRQNFVDMMGMLEPRIRAGDTALGQMMFELGLSDSPGIPGGAANNNGGGGGPFGNNGTRGGNSTGGPGTNSGTGPNGGGDRNINPMTGTGGGGGFRWNGLVSPDNLNGGYGPNTTNPDAVTTPVNDRGIYNVLEGGGGAMEMNTINGLANPGINDPRIPAPGGGQPPINGLVAPQTGGGGNVSQGTVAPATGGGGEISQGIAAPATGGGSGMINMVPGADGTFRAADETDRYGNFRNTPGYQYMLDEGRRGIEGSASARGMLLRGSTLRRLQEHAAGLADQTYGNYWNRLASVAGVGQTATGQAMGVGQNYANNLSNLYMGAGDARASSYLTNGAVNSNFYGHAGSTVGNLLGGVNWDGMFSGKGGK